MITPASPTTQDIVAKLWSLCHVLRDDGVGYSEYVTELTYLLFLKMMAEVRDPGGTLREARLPQGYRWSDLARREGEEQLIHYRRMLLELGDPTKITDGLVRAIFADAQTRLKRPANLKTLTSAIDRLDWYSAREEGLGDLYEGLLEKNAAEKKSGGGSVFHATAPNRLHRAIDEASRRRSGARPGSRDGGLSGRGRPVRESANGRSLQAARGAAVLSTTRGFRRVGARDRHAPTLPDEPDAARH